MAAKNININLKIWRQKNSKAKGQMETYKLNNVSTDSSFLEMLDQLNEQLIEEADQMIEEIKTKMIGLIKVTNDTIEDYYAYKYGKSIRQIAPAEMVSGINILINMGIALALGFMIGVIIVFLRYYWKHTEAKNESFEKKSEQSA